MPSVKIHEKESFERALRRFERAVEKSGVLRDYRKHEFYEKPSAKRKRQKAAAVKREQRNTAAQSPFKRHR